VGSTVGLPVGPSVAGAVRVAFGAVVVSTPVVGVVSTLGGNEVAVSFPLNGLTSTRPISASKTAAAAPSLSTLGPPYRPNGPRTGYPSSSTQNLQPAGAGGHDSAGFQRFGGFHRAFGGSGHPGGALNCLT
jgi:hypothetical protein